MITNDSTSNLPCAAYSRITLTSRSAFRVTWKRLLRLKVAVVTKYVPAGEIRRIGFKKLPQRLKPRNLCTLLARLKPCPSLKRLAFLEGSSHQVDLNVFAQVDADNV